MSALRIVTPTCTYISQSTYGMTRIGSTDRSVLMGFTALIGPILGGGTMILGSDTTGITIVHTHVTSIRLSGSWITTGLHS